MQPSVHHGLTVNACWTSWCASKSAEPRKVPEQRRVWELQVLGMQDKLSSSLLLWFPSCRSTKESSERSANLSRVSQLTIWGQLSSLSLADCDPVFLPIHLSSLPSLLSSTFPLPSFSVIPTFFPPSLISILQSFEQRLPRSFTHLAVLLSSQVGKPRLESGTTTCLRPLSLLAASTCVCRASRHLC